MLHVFERGSLLSLCDRALLLLATAAPELSVDELALLPVGARDRRLLQLRAACFGDEIAILAHCPRCEAPSEFSVSAQALAAVEADTHEPGEAEQLSFGSALVRYRLPNTNDIARLEQLEPDEAERKLVEACLLEATVLGVPTPFASLPPELSDALSRAMTEADPVADLSFDLGCPACSHRWGMSFDIVSVLWSDVERRARRLLQEVDALARVYGWREDDVLGMSSRRRALYLEMALS